MKTFKLIPDITPVTEHLIGLKPKSVILDAAHMSATPMSEEALKQNLGIAARINEKLNSAGIPVEPQLLVEDPNTNLEDITAQIKLAQKYGIDFDSNIIQERDLHPAALTLIETLKEVTQIIKKGNDTFWAKGTDNVWEDRSHEKGQIFPSGLIKLTSSNTPSGAMVDAALAQTHADAGKAMVTIVSKTFADQQKKLIHVLKKLGIEAQYTTVLHS